MSTDANNGRRQGGGVFRTTHASTNVEIEALMRQIRCDADQGAGITATWMRTSAGHAYVQIALHSLDEAADVPQTTSSDAFLMRQVRGVLQNYRDLPALEMCALAGMLKTVTAARASATDGFPCAHALQALILRSIEWIDRRPTRRSLTLRSVFEQTCMLGLSQERSAEILHVEDRTIRRAMQELAAALIKYWIETHELDAPRQEE